MFKFRWWENWWEKCRINRWNHNVILIGLFGHIEEMSFHLAIFSLETYAFSFLEGVYLYVRKEDQKGRKKFHWPMRSAFAFTSLDFSLYVYRQSNFVLSFTTCGSTIATKSTFFSKFSDRTQLCSSNGSARLCIYLLYSE